MVWGWPESSSASLWSGPTAPGPLPPAPTPCRRLPLMGHGVPAAAPAGVREDRGVLPRARQGEDDVQYHFGRPPTEPAPSQSASRATSAPDPLPRRRPSPARPAATSGAS